MTPLVVLGDLLLQPGMPPRAVGVYRGALLLSCIPRPWESLGPLRDLTLTGLCLRPPAPLVWIFHAHSSCFWTVCGYLTFVSLLPLSHGTCYHELTHTVPPEETLRVNPELARTSKSRTFCYE